MRHLQKALQVPLPGRGVEQVAPTHDLVDALQVIIHDHSELIREPAVTTSHDEIADVAFELLAEDALQSVVDCHLEGRRAYASRRRTSGAAHAAAARTRVNGSVVAGSSGGIPARTGALVNQPAGGERLERRPIVLGARTLIGDCIVPLESKALEITEDRIRRAWFFARWIEIL